MELVRQFGERTSMHGIGKIFESTQLKTKRSKRVKQIYWATICLSLFSVMMYNVIGSIYKYFEYHIVVNEQQKLGDPLPYPAVTICSERHFKTKEIMDLISLLVTKAFLSANWSFSILDNVSIPSLLEERLSVTVTLSDPKDYKGGELEFDFRNQDPDKKPNIKKCTEILPKGSLVVFPGFVWHRVCPVKKGSRHSLVIWNLGWPYK